MYIATEEQLDKLCEKAFNDGVKAQKRSQESLVKFWKNMYDKANKELVPVKRELQEKTRAADFWEKYSKTVRDVVTAEWEQKLTFMAEELDRAEYKTRRYRTKLRRAGIKP